MNSALIKTLAAAGIPMTAEPVPGTCTVCGVTTLPQYVGATGGWWAPSVCGVAWMPGDGEPKGCQGAQDHAAWREEERQHRQERRLVAAGFPSKKKGLRRKMAFDPPPFLLNFEREGGDHCAACLFGATGTGKTTALAGAARVYLERGWGVRYATESQILSSLRPQDDRHKTDKAKVTPRTLEWWAERELLLIDELCGPKLTTWGVGEISEIINERYDSERPLIVATNATPEIIRNLYGERLVDRLKEMGGGSMATAFVEMVWSWRHPDANGRPTRRRLPGMEAPQ